MRLEDIQALWDIIMEYGDATGNLEAESATDDFNQQKYSAANVRWTDTLGKLRTKFSTLLDVEIVGQDNLGKYVLEKSDQ